MPKNDVIWHYCSLETFQKVIETRSFRLSEVTKSNDYLEIKWARNLFSSMVESYFWGQSINDNCEHLASIFDIAKNRLKQTNLYCFALCFTTLRDDLHCWQSYANNGNGISIGIKQAALEDFNINSALFDKSKKSTLKYYTSVIYDKDALMTETEKIVNSALDGFEKIKNKYLSDNYEANDKTEEELSCDLDGLLNDIIIDSLLIFPKYKNPAFKIEQEQRIVVISLMYSAFMQGLLKKDAQLNCELIGESFAVETIPQFQVKNNCLVPYMNMRINQTLDNVITELVVGPKCNVSIEELLSYSHFQGLYLTDKQVSKSLASYQ